MLTFADQFLELGSLELLLRQLADVPFVHSLDFVWYFNLVVAFVSHLIDELQRVEQNIFLSFAELFVRHLERLRLLLYLPYPPQVDLFFKDFQSPLHT